MKSTRTLLLIASIIFLAAAGIMAQSMLKSGQKILFIGNSKVGSEGGLHHHFRRTLARLDTPIEVETDWIAMYGARTLGDMLTDAVKTRIEKGDDDLIIVQSGSISDLKTFAQLVTAANKQMLVFGAWQDNPYESSRSPVANQKILHDQYQALKAFETSSNVLVAPAGLAINELYAHPPRKHIQRSDYLFTPATSIQNDLGTFVNISMLYTTLTNNPPSSLPIWDPFPKSVIKKIHSKTFSVYKQWKKGNVKASIISSNYSRGSELAMDLKNAPSWPAILKPNSKIYYVGNSYIGTEGGLENHFPRILKEINSPYKIGTKSQIYWGQGLARMHTDIVQRQIAEGDEDIVVVTSGPRIYLDSFYRDITAAGKQMVVHMTWGRNPTINDGGMDGYRTQSKKIEVETKAFAAATGVPIVPCGSIYYDLISNPPVFNDIQLRKDWTFIEENIHQNQFGTMINAAAHYAVLTGQSPVGLPMWDPYPQKLVRVVQERVWQIVKQWKQEE